MLLFRIRHHGLKMSNFIFTFITQLTTPAYNIYQQYVSRHFHALNRVIFLELWMHIVHGISWGLMALSFFVFTRVERLRL